MLYDIVSIVIRDPLQAQDVVFDTCTAEHLLTEQQHI